MLCKKKANSYRTMIIFFLCILITPDEINEVEKLIFIFIIPI